MLSCGAGSAEAGSGEASGAAGLGCAQRGAVPRVACPPSAPSGRHVLGGPCLPPGLGDLLKHPGMFLALRCSIQVLVSSRNASKVFAKSSLFPHLYISVPCHPFGFVRGSWRRLVPPGSAARSCPHSPPPKGRWSVERGARTGLRHVAGCREVSLKKPSQPPQPRQAAAVQGEGESQRPQVCRALRPRDAVTDQQQHEEKQGQRARVFTKPNAFLLKAIRWSFTVRFSNSVGRAFFFKKSLE